MCNPSAARTGFQIGVRVPIEVLLVGVDRLLHLPFGSCAGQHTGDDILIFRQDAGDFSAGDGKAPLVLQDAAHLDAGQIEDSGVYMVVVTLEDQQVGGFAGQGNHSAVGMNGAALDDGRIHISGDVGNFDRSPLLALLGEHLDACVFTDVMGAVVGLLLAIEKDRRSARRLGVRGHLQLFFGGLLKLLRRARRQ